MAKIELIRGDSRTITIPITNPDGTAKNLTGCTVYFTVNATKEPVSDASAVIAKSTTSFASPTTGIATISLTNADTQNITPGSYYYDVQLKDASGNISSEEQDRCVVKPDTTRSVA